MHRNEFEIQKQKKTYTEEGGQLFQDSPFLSFDSEGTHVVLGHKTFRGTDIFNCRLEVDRTRDHMRFRIPAGVNRLNHAERFDLCSNT